LFFCQVPYKNKNTAHFSSRVKQSLRGKHSHEEGAIFI
jgi:hypothetical protein